MGDYMGIVRTTKRLERALRRSRRCNSQLMYYAHFRISNNLLELRNLLQVAELMVRCAMARKESPRAALHTRLSEALGEALPTILAP